MSDVTPQKIYSTVEAAEYLGASVRTIERWRVEGGGPRYIRVHARCVRYRLVDLDAWLNERIFAHTAEEVG